MHLREEAQDGTAQHESDAKACEPTALIVVVAVMFFAWCLLQLLLVLSLALVEEVQLHSLVHHAAAHRENKGFYLLMFIKAPGLVKKLRRTSGGLDTHTTFAAVIAEKFQNTSGTPLRAWSLRISAGP